MRKFLMIFGAVCLAIVVLIVGAVAFLALQGNELDDEGAAFVDDAVAAMARDWRAAPEELLSRASPELKSMSKKEDTQALCDVLSELGPLLDYEGAKGQANVLISVGTGKTITGVYEARAVFRSGEATFRITLVKIEDKWMIHGFHVESPVFLRRAS